MTKFIFKSNASDLQKISQQLETIQKNILYITYRTDSILKTLNRAEVDKGLQTQVSDFYEEQPDQSTGRDETPPDEE